MKRKFISFAAIAMMASVALTSCAEDAPEVTPEVKPESTVLSGTLSEDLTLEANGAYTLDGSLIVPDGLTLTIEEGVKITAVDGGEVDFILVQQGGKIDAQGTASKPIVMTAEVKEHGAWGGIHICGKAKTNLGEQGTSEVGNSIYGGTDDADNSGVLKYVRVEYAGYLYSEDKECNGFTFYGVGNGTTLENLTAYKGSDDGYEWFGGCVNAKNLISIDNYDDSFDWTYGFRGTIDGAYAHQLSDKCDHLFEGDNNKSDNSAAPVSHPTFKNATLIGVNRDKDNRGIRIRRGSELTLENAVVYGKSNSFDFQSEATKNYFSANAATALVDVTATGAIIDADANEPLEAEIFEGLTTDLYMVAPATPSWATGAWAEGADTNDTALVGTVLRGATETKVTLEEGKSYTLDGAYTVKDGGLLVIEKGVKITAVDGGEVDFILVQQGGKIEAVGTADAPIVMTAEVEEHGAWGGIHICGKAKTNIGTGISEVGASEYGGNDDADNSGVLSFVRVEYAGYLYSEEKECNGFTFYGVGNGTTLNNLIAYKGSDDGYEWFGGCVNAKELVSIDNQDDSFDWTYGFTGTIDGAYAKHLSEKCDHLLEGDSNKSDSFVTPISHPTFKNAVFVGRDNLNGGDRGLRIRRGSELTLENAVVVGKTNSFDFQSEATKKYFTDNAATALVSVSASGAIIDAADNAPVAASAFAGLTVDADLEATVPTWATGAWVVLE